MEFTRQPYYVVVHNQFPFFVPRRELFVYSLNIGLRGLSGHRASSPARCKKVDGANIIETATTTIHSHTMQLSSEA